MARYIDADELLNNLPDDLPYKASVKRVLIQAPSADVVPKSEVIDEFAERLKGYYNSLKGQSPTPAIVYRIDQIAKEMKGGTQ